jgi:hypothetical protein
MYLSLKYLKFLNVIITQAETYLSSMRASVVALVLEDLMVTYPTVARTMETSPAIIPTFLLSLSMTVLSASSVVSAAVSAFLASL